MKSNFLFQITLIFIFLTSLLRCSRLKNNISASPIKNDFNSEPTKRVFNINAKMLNDKAENAVKNAQSFSSIEAEMIKTAKQQALKKIEEEKAAELKAAQDTAKKAAEDKAEDSKVAAQYSSNQAGYSVVTVPGHQPNTNKPQVAVGVPHPGAAVINGSGVIEKTEVTSTFSLGSRLGDLKP